MDICGSNGRFVIESDKMSVSSKAEFQNTFSEKVTNSVDEGKIAYALLHAHTKEVDQLPKSKVIKHSTMDIIGNSVTIRYSNDAETS